jgi:four helix bundle protein
MKIERFEDIVAWQKARELTNLIYDAAEKEKFSKDFILRNQITAAAGGSMHNVAEGFDAGYDTEFVRFLKFARRSATEVQSEAYLALDRGYIVQEEFQAIYDKVTEVKKLVNAFIGYLNRSKK